MIERETKSAKYCGKQYYFIEYVNAFNYGSKQGRSKSIQSTSLDIIMGMCYEYYQEFQA